MRHCFVLSLFFILGAALDGQTLADLRVGPSGGTATYRPMDSVRPPIKDKPVSYESHTVHAETLADGNHITRTIGLQRFWRDTQGRTRLERYLAPVGEPADVSMWTAADIADPVTGFWYLLERENKIAHRGRMPAPTPPTQPNADSPVASNSESLGSQIINGVVAEGRATTSTALGPQGKDRIPLTIETWISPELEITMLRKVRNPVNGDTTTELRNFSRADSETNFFTPPQDYRIVDETMPFTLHGGRLLRPMSPTRAGCTASARASRLPCRPSSLSRNTPKRLDERGFRAEYSSPLRLASTAGPAISKLFARSAMGWTKKPSRPSKNGRFDLPRRTENRCR
jgi:hypothetical protein